MSDQQNATMMGVYWHREMYVMVDDMRVACFTFGMATTAVESLIPVRILALPRCGNGSRSILT